MFLAWRTQLREAQQASELGRLDDAAQRLLTHKLLQYKPGEEFARSLATAYLARAVRRAEEANFEGAAHDLAQAKQLGGANEHWQATQSRVTQIALTGHAGAKMADARLPSADPGRPAPATESLRPTPMKADAGTRLMLWVDAVGGFLVCLADELWIGQAAPGNAIAIPIQAELSRQHAKLTRSGEGYVLEAAHPVSIDGRPVVGKRVLIDGEEMELGRGVRIRFRQPHSLSATAKLEILSRHRTQPHCNGVLLMAESCVLGPKWQDHIVCKDWANDVVLYRQQNALFCRASEQVEIDGVTYQSRGPLQPHSHVTGEDFSFSLEPLA